MGKKTDYSLIHNLLYILMIQSMVLTGLPSVVYSAQSMLSPSLNVSASEIHDSFRENTPDLLPDPDLCLAGPKGTSWLEENHPDLFKQFQQTPLVTVCVEGNDPWEHDSQRKNSDTKGGLGADFGDMRLGFHKIGLKHVAFQPEYTRRRRQQILIKENGVYHVMKQEFSDLNWHNFSQYANTIIEIMNRLADQNELTFDNFSDAVKKNDELRLGILDDGATRDESRTQVQNIEYIYTTASSVMIRESLYHNCDQCKKSVYRIFKNNFKDRQVTDEQANQLLNIVFDLAKSKEFTLENFQEKCQKEGTILTEFDYKVFYREMKNYLARLSIEKMHYIGSEDSTSGEGKEYFLNKKQDRLFTVSVTAMNPDNPNEDIEYHVRFTYRVDGDSLKIGLECPEIYDLLYCPDSDQSGKRRRFNQYVVGAMAIYGFIKNFSEFTPGFLHANESPFVGLMALMMMDDELKRVPQLYTNHTVTPAGLPVFDGDIAGVSTDRLFSAMFKGYRVGKVRYAPNPTALEKMKEVFIHFGKVDFSRAAAALADATNGVSGEHAIVTQKMFDLKDKVVPVLNGSSDYWVNEHLIALENKVGKDDVTGNDLFDIQKNGKKRFIDEIESRTGSRFDKNKMVISLIRRLADYKSQYPILKDIIRVICADTDETVSTRFGELKGLGQQVVIGGFASPFSDQERWIFGFLQWMKDPDLHGRVVFVPDSDEQLLKLQAIGSDICINCPLPFEEACGTSDQRNARNGGLNVLVYDSGGGKEYLHPVDAKKRTGSAWMIGKSKYGKDMEHRSITSFLDKAPEEILLALTEASGIFYDNNELWKQLMLNAYKDSEHVSGAAMAKRYVEDALPVAQKNAQLRIKHDLAVRITSRVAEFLGIDSFEVHEIEKAI